MTQPPAVRGNKSNSKWAVVALALLGILLLVFYRLGTRIEGTKDIAWFLKILAAQIPLYVITVWLSLRHKESRALLIVGLVFAALFRLSILFAPPYLSDDIYRYIWDGRVQAAGINPYRYIPADQSLANLRDEKIYPNINRRDYAHTIYPPVAEAVFFLTTRLSESVTWMKATMVGFEALAIWAIVQLLGSFGMAQQRVLIYAWHPLTVWEFAGSGHVDAIAIAFVALALLARRKNLETATGFALACATLVKFFPAVLIPAVYKRWSWKMPLAFVVLLAVAYLPYLSVGPIGAFGFLPGFAHEQQIVSGDQFFVLQVIRRLPGSSQFPTFAFLSVGLLAIGALAVWSMQRPQHAEDDYILNGLIVASAFMFLMSPHWAWYFAWLIPFLCFVPRVPIFYLTLASFLLYLTWYGDNPDRNFRVKASLYLPCVVLVVLAVWWRRRREKPLVIDASR